MFIREFESEKILFCSHRRQRYSRAYIDFKNPEDVLEFADFFHGHVFVNEKGTLVANLLWIAWNFLACHIFYALWFATVNFEGTIDRERLILGESFKKCLFCFKKYKVFGVLILIGSNVFSFVLLFHVTVSFLSAIRFEVCDYWNSALVEGSRFKAIVEHAPFQCVPKPCPHKDSCEGTIYRGCLSFSRLWYSFCYFSCYVARSFAYW